MKKIIISIISLIFCFGLGTPALAADLPHCQGIDQNAECTQGQCGVFMCGVSRACSDLGNCSTQDLMQVFANTGNLVLAAVGSFVLLMYIIGGVYMIAGGAKPDMLTKGKQMIKISTIGLLIVFVGWAGVYTLERALKTGTTGSGNYRSCNEDTVNQECQGPRTECVMVDIPNSSEVSYQCKTLCDARNLNMNANEKSYQCVANTVVQPSETENLEGDFYECLSGSLCPNITDRCCREL